WPKLGRRLRAAGARGDVMQQKTTSGSVTYQKVDDAYFEARGLKRHAGVWLLWALGVGAVISGHFSGWNLGLASGGWGACSSPPSSSPSCISALPSRSPR